MDYHSSDEFINIKPIDSKPLRFSFLAGDIVMKRPTLEQYLKFESDFATLLARFIDVFRGVGFLSYEELEDVTLKGEFKRQLGSAIRNQFFLRYFKGFLKKHRNIFSYPEGVKEGNIEKYLTLSEIEDLFLGCHFIVMSEKKNSQAVLEEMLGTVLSGYSIFSRKSSVGGAPRFSPPK